MSPNFVGDFQKKTAPRRFPWNSKKSDRDNPTQAMRNNPKTLRQSPRPAALPTAEQLHTVQVAVTALNTALAPLLQPLTEGEIRDLLAVGIANESFTRDYVNLVTAHPDLLPGYLRTAETQASWEARDAFAATAQAVAQVTRKLDTTVKALQSDCYAAALNGYRILVQGGVPAGFEGEVAPLREHMAQRQARRRETRANRLALKAAKDALAAANGGGGESPAPPATTLAAEKVTVMPMNASVASAKARNGSAPTALAA